MAAGLRARIALGFRSLLSNSPTGIPEWTPLIAAGDEPGLYFPNDAPWVVHGDVATLVGGIRALLVQALHPGTLAGVAQHSRYEEDFLGRLAGTIRWLTILTFAAPSAIAAESERVNGMHARVRGRYAEGDGATRDYRATDPDLLLWVHAAFTDSFLAAHEAFGAGPIPGGADEYVRLWGRSVQPLGVTNAPQSRAELQQVLADYAPVLRCDERTRRVVHFIRRAPFPLAVRPAFALLFQAAVVTLPPAYRQLLGLRTLPAPLVRPLTRAALHVLRRVLGSTSPLEAAALQRLARIGAPAQ